jgi:hypothetical protein
MSSISHTFSICLFVVHRYDMSLLRHIHSRYIISYDISIIQSSDSEYSSAHGHFEREKSRVQEVNGLLWWSTTIRTSAP